MPALRDYLPFLRRTRVEAALVERTQTGLVSSAAPLNLGDRSEAKRVRVLRQGWQDDAWAYHDTIGEIRFARRYLANSARRMRLFPAVYPRGTYDDAPEPVDEADFLPAEVVAAAEDALTALGSGRLAISQVMYDTSSQLSMAGEGYVHGHTDPMTGDDTWRIRSISEITVRNDEYVLREVPVDAMGIFGWSPLDPDLDYVARFWTPHPKFQMLADSSMRSILDSCEELLILSRTVRATGRSRLAGAGILKVPEGLSVSTSTNDNLDPQSDPFIEALTDAMLTPIGDEGTASAVVPLVVRGNSDALKALEHLTLDRPIDDVMMKQRDELIGRIATGIDLPKEVLTGLIDLNHWSAWQVSDDTFRHHIEPHVQECVDCLTVGYYRAALEADPRMQGANAAWISRLSLWYDPTDLVTHPDRSQDALQLHNRLVISDQALREATGFTEEDAPDELETQVRMIRNTRTFPPNVLEALFHRLDPTLLIPPTSGGGALPGEGPTGAVPSPPKPELPGGGATPQPTGAEGTPAVTGPPPKPVPALVAAPQPAAPRVDTDLSTRLVQIDRELRTRLQVAASHALLAVLSRAGAKVRSKVQKDETLRVAINQVPNHHVTATLGQPVVSSLGLSSLVDTDWSDVRTVFDQWGTAAQQASLHAAVKALRLSATDPQVVQVQARQSEAREKAWHVMAEGLTALAHRLLYDPNPNGDPEDSLERANPDTLVPTGLVRQVLNVLGGGDGTGKKPMTASAIFDAPDITMTLGAEDPMPQVGTGEDVSGLLEDGGATVEGYTWVHGFALKPFDPHLELDGVEFSSFDDEQLANPDTFPAVEYFLPGDHKGCTCDFMPGWALPMDENYLAGNDAPGALGAEGDGWTPEGATADLEVEPAAQEAGSTWSSLIDDLLGQFEGVKLDVVDHDAYVSIDRIVVDQAERNSGIGSKIMGKIVDKADAEGRVLTLTPSSDFGGSLTKLKAWYRDLGFEPNRGKFFESTDSMVRFPDPAKLVQAAETRPAALSEVEKDAVYAYQGSGYSNLNNLLRGLPAEDDSGEAVTMATGHAQPLPGGEPSAAVRMTYSEMLDHLDASIASQPGLAADTTVTRVVRFTDAGQEAMDQFLSALQPGAEFTDEGFVSTSAGSKLLDQALRSDGLDVGMEIKLPTGAQVLDINGTTTRTAFEYEEEFLLPRGTTFRVDGITGPPGHPILHVTALLGGAK